MMLFTPRHDTVCLIFPLHLLLFSSSHKSRTNEGLRHKTPRIVKYNKAE